MSKCIIKECKAACCYNVPLPRRLMSAYRKRVVNSVIDRMEVGNDVYIYFTANDIEKNKCPFLRADYRCNIYDQRPSICRLYGTHAGMSQFLRCGYLEGADKQPVEVEVDKAMMELLMNCKSFYDYIP